MDALGNQYCITWNTAKGDSRRDMVVYLINAQGNAVITATFVSMDDDGFTLNFSVVDSMYDLYWDAIG